MKGDLDLGLTPDRLSVADITYVSTWSIGVRGIRRRLRPPHPRVGAAPRACRPNSSCMRSSRRSGPDTAPAMHRSPTSSPTTSGQYTPVRYSERLALAVITLPVAAVGSSYDAPAQTINGLHKTELIKPCGSWRTADDVEYDTAEWSTGSTTTA